MTDTKTEYDVANPVECKGSWSDVKSGMDDKHTLMMFRLTMAALYAMLSDAELNR